MAYIKQIWNTSSIFNPTRMNHIEEGIQNIKDGTITTLEPTTNETWESLFGRLRQSEGVLSSGYYQYYKLRFKPTSASQNSNLIFTCTKFTANSTIEYISSRLTTDGIVFYHLAINTSSVVLNQIVVNSNGVAFTDLTTNAAQGSIRVMGLSNDE